MSRQNSMHDRLSYYYDWTPVFADPAAFRAVIREFLDNGVSRFVIDDKILYQMVLDPEKIAFLHQICKEMEVDFCSVHGMAGPKFELNIPDAEMRETMFRGHIRAMEIASDFGCRTYVVHVGSSENYGKKHMPLSVLRPLALDTLEKLVPAAEKNGMTIAVENVFGCPDSTDEVLGLVSHFGGSPAIGVCYDTGHANCMAPAPDKDKALYPEYILRRWWETGVIQEDRALEKLRDYVVTCHIHDNKGYRDQHGMPFDGTINWRELMPKLFDCPGMIDFQTEVVLEDGKNWAGPLLAPVGGYSIRRLADTFRYLGF